MSRVLWLAVITAGLIFYGCDSPEQPKPPSAPAVQQPMTEAKAPSAQGPAAASTTPALEVTEKAQEPAEKAAAVASAAPAPPEKNVVTVVDQAAANVGESAGKAAKQVETATSAATASETAKQLAAPGEIILEAGNGNVTFPHGMHAEAFACTTCHSEAPPAAFGISKDIAHKLCKDCHKSQGAGPTVCNGCHKKQT